MTRMSPFLVILTLTTGCSHPVEDLCRNVILPEQLSIDYRDPSQFPPAKIPDNAPPRTVANPQPETPVWELSLDEAIRVALVNARVIRVLSGTTAVSSGQTIYDAAITNTTIDQAQATFDPTLKWNNTWSRTDSPLGSFSSNNFQQSTILSTPQDAYLSDFGITKTNVLGGQWSLDWTANPMRFSGSNASFAGLFPGTIPASPLNPQDPTALTLSYTQPLLRGGGFPVNMAPIVIARLNAEQSFFQYKDSTQELVRSVITAYWNLVQARITVWASKIQVEQSGEAFRRAEAQLKTGLAAISDVAQARVTYTQFKAALISNEANVLTQEGALRNLLGLPPNDNRNIVPVSAPTTQRLKSEWNSLIRLAEQRRPDIIELKIITEADQQRLLQAQNQVLPQLNLVGAYTFNGLDGTMGSGSTISTGPGQFSNWSIGVNFSVPFGLRQGRAQVRQGKLMIARDRANVEQSVHAAIHQLAATIRDLDSAYEQYVAYRETRDAATANLRTQFDLFKQGGPKSVIYLNVLQALNDWGNAVSSEAQQLLLYNTALATLERQTGTILETHGLVFFEERFRAAGPLLCTEMYPYAQPPTGTPQLYPGTGQPGEESFDLKNPVQRDKIVPGDQPKPKNPMQQDQKQPDAELPKLKNPIQMDAKPPEEEIRWRVPQQVP
jgi:outer membrane protein TolC